MDAVLLVFAKVPRPGRVKTRLTPVLTPAEAAQLYEAFLRDALQLYARLHVDVRLYLAPPFPDVGLDGVPDEVTVREQRGEGLGPRMKNAFQEVFDADYERATIVGTDHPTLPPSFVRQSFNVIEADSSLCVGPSEDGGFYLLGMSAFYPQLFEGMTYSHGKVFTNTLTRIGRTDARLTVLPRWYDVDTPDTLERMIRDLEQVQHAIPHTRSVVDDLNLTELPKHN